jgi:hypothetical protein
MFLFLKNLDIDSPFFALEDLEPREEMATLPLS